MILDARTFQCFEDWADQLSLILGQYGNVPTIISAKDWPRWASAVLQFPVISGQSPPFPNQYSDWRKWAADFNNSVNLSAQ